MKKSTLLRRSHASKKKSTSQAGPGKRREPVMVAGVGASAGGLRAIQEFLIHLPAGLDMAFVLVQHLEPTHESLLADILSRGTSLPVIQAADRQQVEPGHVYVIPPNSYISLAADRLRITPRKKLQDNFRPVDYFLASLAKERNEKAIAVILSGTGSDGAQGAEAVHAAGGVVFAQDDKSAQYPEMPASAVAAQAVSYILPPAEIAGRLGQVRQAPGAVVFHPEEEENVPGQNVLDEIFRLVLQSTGLDFTHYKHTTLLRRLKRRLAMQNLRQMEEYLDFLKKNPVEVTDLVRDFLIPVTSFFRDPAYFDYLRKKIFPALVENRDPGDPLRIWVPGCSTGEEVYSLAMCLSDFLDSRKLKTPVQFFGTDVNDAAIAKARSGIFSPAISKPIPTAYLKRFFTQTDQGYKVDKYLRDLCLFSRHNIISDPPFSNIDLLSFRNVLIYMDSDLQNDLFPRLHFALKSSGYLMLGTSEGVGAFNSYFRQVDKRYKIYSKKSTGERERFHFAAGPSFPEPVSEKKVPAGPAEARYPEKELDRMLIDKYAPAGVLVNNRMEILLFRGSTGAFLEPAAGRANLNLVGMAREGLWEGMRKAMDAARRQGGPAQGQARVRNANGVQDVSLEVTPVQNPAKGKESYFFIAFKAMGLAEEIAGAPPERANRRREEGESFRLKQENAELRGYLQSQQYELENSSAELKAVQEEMQSSNEELQSMNEELGTSKEEMQSSNEELTTTNEELKNKNAELGQINADLTNVLSGIDVPLVILDPQGKIRRFTKAAQKVMYLVNGDAGRSINEIKLKFGFPGFERMIGDVIKQGMANAAEIQDEHGNWYTLAVRPNRGPDEKLEGVLLSFFDVTRIKESQLFAQSIVATVRHPLLVLDAELKIVMANHAFYAVFKTLPEETEGRFLYDLGNRQWDIPKLRELLEQIIPRNNQVQDYLVLHAFPGIGEKTMLLNASRVEHDRGRTALLLLAIEDITVQTEREAELKRAADLLQSANERKDNFLAMLAHELRNPMAPIQNALELMRRDPAAQARKMAHWVEMIRRQMHQLSRIMDDLLDTSRISRGLVTLKIEPIDLADAIRQAVEAHRDRIEAKRQSLTVDIPDGPWLLQADPVRLTQVFSNLLHNAYKYTPEGGKIAVRVRRQEQTAVVEVQDTGIGIPKEILPRVFDLFFQEDRSLDRSKGGLGLGLTLVKNLVAMHGGTVEAESNGPNQGSLFRIRLPLEAAASRRVSKSAPLPKESAVPAKLKVLLVEDNLDAADSLSEILREWGHEVWTAFDGQKGLEEAKRVQPDLILLDIGLPRIDGYEVAQRMRATKELSQATLAAITGYNPNPSRISQAGFKAYFTKPLDLEKLEAFLRRVKPGK